MQINKIPIPRECLFHPPIFVMVNRQFRPLQRFQSNFVQGHTIWEKHSSKWANVFCGKQASFFYFNFAIFLIKMNFMTSSNLKTTSIDISPNFLFIHFSLWLRLEKPLLLFAFVYIFTDFCLSSFWKDNFGSWFLMKCVVSFAGNMILICFADYVYWSHCGYLFSVYSCLSKMGYVRCGFLECTLATWDAYNGYLFLLYYYLIIEVIDVICL